MNRHGPLLVSVDASEAQCFHFLRVFRIGYEMEESRALAVLYVAFAVESARIARDGEMHVLASRLRKVQAGQLFYLPVRARMKVMPTARVHNRNFHFSRLIGTVNRPIPGLRLPAERGGQPECRAAHDKNQSHHSSEIHGASPVSALENLGVLE